MASVLGVTHVQATVDCQGLLPVAPRRFDILVKGSRQLLYGVWTRLVPPRSRSVGPVRLLPVGR